MVHWHRSLLILFLAVLFWLSSWLIAPPAWAVVQLPLQNIDYTSCPAEFAEGMVTSGGLSHPARCFLITGEVVNRTGKPIVDADVFGRIYDANGEPVMQNRTRVGSIAEIPVGTSQFEIRISVPENQPLPLRLEQFKASGFAGKVRPWQGSNELS